ncbi:MAG TPA: hypothetical protein VMR33_21555 [Candidatus Baltobacteraceae bacterium]|jgi:phosphoribosylamine-glycine ligase|nr:hypothetical protein [Candidatus Baltobacteraceae bacterium]
MSITPDFRSLGDPLPGQSKILKLKFSRDGVEQAVEVPENENFAFVVLLHQFILSARGANRLEFICVFSNAPVSVALPTLEQSFVDTSKHWVNF